MLCFYYMKVLGVHQCDNSLALLWCANCLHYYYYCYYYYYYYYYYYSDHYRYISPLGWKPAVVRGAPAPGKSIVIFLILYYDTPLGWKPAVIISDTLL